MWSLSYRTNHKQIPWSVYAPDSRCYWLYVNKKKWIVELALQVNWTVHMIIDNIKLLLDTDNELEFVEWMEKDWYYLVWITDSKWNIPEYVIEAFWSEKIVYEKWMFELLDEEGCQEYMIFMPIEWMQKKVEKIKTRIRYSRIKDKKEGSRLKSFDSKWLPIISLNQKVGWLYIDEKKWIIELWYIFPGETRLVITDVTNLLVSDNELSLVNKMRKRWYIFTWLTYWNKLLPNYVTEAFEPKNWDILLHDRIPQNWSEKLVFIYLPTLIWKKKRKLTEDDLKKFKYLKWFSMWSWKEMKTEEVKRWVWISTDRIISQKWQENITIINEWVDWLYFDYNNQIVYLVERDIKTWKLSNIDIRKNLKNEKEQQIEEYLRKDWFFLVWLTNEDGSFPKYVLEVFDIKQTKFLIHKRPWIKNQEFIFAKIPWFEKQKVWIDKNTSIHVIDDWVEWLYIDNQKWLVELALISKQNWRVVIWNIKKMLRNETEELFVRTQETLWYHFVWVTDNNWNYPKMVKEAIDLKKYKHFSFPRTWDNSWKRLIFAKIPWMPKPKETYNQLIQNIENE